MKKLLVLFVLVSATLAVSACGGSEANPGASKAETASPAETKEVREAKDAAATAEVEKALVEMDREWIEAVAKKDKATLDRLVADDWVGINEDGIPLTKAESIARVLDQNSKLESYTLDPPKVRVFGDFAVITGGDTEKSSLGGKDTSGRYVWTDVYLKRDGKWQAVASHWSRVPTTKPQP